jgi:Flp pilus assembly protein TadD
LDVGRILLEAHRPKGALEAAKTALSLAPDSARAYDLKGLAESELTQPIDAYKSYLQAFKLDPNDPKALLGLALAQEREGKTQDAQATFEKGIRQYPSNAVLYQEYGKMLLIFRGEDPEASEAHAISLLTKAIALDNSLGVSHFELGNLALSKGQLEQAVTQLEAAVKLSPDDSRAHYALSRAYRRLGRVEDADRELKIFQSLKGKGTG